MRPTCAAQHDGARLRLGDAAEVDEAVLADHDLLNQLGVAQLGRLRRVKGAGDVAACMLSQMMLVRSGCRAHMMMLFAPVQRVCDHTQLLIPTETLWCEQCKAAGSVASLKGLDSIGRAAPQPSHALRSITAYGILARGLAADKHTMRKKAELAKDPADSEQSLVEIAVQDA